MIGKMVEFLRETWLVWTIYAVIVLGGYTAYYHIARRRRRKHDQITGTE